MLLNTQVTGREATLPAPRGTDYAASLRMRFEKFSLTAEIGPVKIEEKQILPQEIRRAFNEGIKLCEGVAYVNRTGQVTRTEADVRRLDPANGQVYKQVIIDPVMDSLMAASVQLPNKQVQPGETWGQKKTVRFAIQFVQDPRVTGPGGKKDRDDDDMRATQRPNQPKGARQARGVREYRYQEEITYKYIGTRTRQGVREAVLEVTGTISPAPGVSEGSGASGRVKGYACLDLDTGTVIECEVDREFEVDSSVEGIKKRLSGVNTYKVTRGTPTAGSA